MNFFVTGTDTGVGKTYVTRVIVEMQRREGIDAVAYKPVACGDREDAEILAKASGGLALDLINPVFLKTAVSPYVASLLENQTFSKEALLEGYRQLATAHEQVFVEGAGGWEVPLLAGYRFSDFAKDLNLPVIVVAGNRLGVLNHLLLTIDAIRAKGLTCAGVYLNQLGDELDTAMITNRGVIEDLAGVPLLDHLIHEQDFIDTSTLSSYSAST